jgi:hypothetical protein
MDNQSNSQQRRRAQNESIFRERNDNIERLASGVIDKSSQAGMLIEFSCECSNEDCTDGIGLSLAEYKQLRRNDRQFMVKPGHQQADIESVAKYSGYVIVEKYVDPPPSDGKLNST